MRPQCVELRKELQVVKSKLVQIVASVKDLDIKLKRPAKEVIETKYGDITDPEVIDMANSLHLWFIDSINDAVYSGEDEYQEYFAARNLFSYPE
jgi:hypothetical protein